MRVERVAKCLPAIKSPIERFVDNIATSAMYMFRQCLPSTKLVSDIFEHQMEAASREIPQMDATFSKKQVERFFRLPYTLFSKQYLDLLSSTNYRKILRYASECEQIEKFAQEHVEPKNCPKKIKEVLKQFRERPPKASNVCEYKLAEKIDGFFEDVSEVSAYGKIILAALKKMFHDKNLKVIGVGQSPATIVEYLSLRGIDTALCPASALTRFDEAIKKMRFSKEADTYAKYLKNFGLDVDAIDMQKTHVFLDFEVSGRSLQNFRTLITPHLPSKTDTMFIGLQKLRETMNKELSAKEVKDAERFEGMSLWTCALKSLYSPIFRLPLDEIGNIEHIHKKSCPSNQTIAFNKLKLLLYDALYGKTRKSQN